MSARTLAADSYSEIAKRRTEIQNERMQAIAGCVCPTDLIGKTLHKPDCPLRPMLTVQIAVGKPSAMPAQQLPQPRYIYTESARRMMRREILSISVRRIPCRECE